jgi:hypothetical protein
MSLQRSLQNGRYTDAEDHCTARLQVGHLTMVAIECFAEAYAQQVNKKGTSTST